VPGSRISIVTPACNAERFLDRTIAGVLGQTVGDWEYVIVDDGSTDGTAAVVRRHTGDPRVRLVQQANAGAIAARDAGHRATDPASPYVLFLDADDALEPEMLATMAAYLDDRPEVGMAFCDASWIDGDDRPITYGSPGTRYVPTRLGVRLLPEDHPDTPFIALFFWGRVGPSVALLRRSMLEAAGGWDQGQGYYAEDLDLWLRMALRSSVHFVPRRLVRRRIHGENYGLRADARAQERRLYRRWLDADWLAPDERRMVRDAWRLRQRRFLPYLWRRWGTDYLRRGELTQAAVCYLRSARRLATYAAATARGRLPAGPVW